MIFPIFASAQTLPPTPQQLQSLSSEVSKGKKENIVKLFSVQNPQELAVVSAFADLASAKHQLALAVSERFGQKGTDYLFAPSTPDATTQTAETTPAGAGIVPPIPAAWLINLLASDARSKPAPAQTDVQEIAEVLNVQSRVFADITQFTRDGKFSTPQELGQMLRSQLALALVPAEPTSNPTTQPAP